MSTALTHIKTEKQLVPAIRFKEFDGHIDNCKLDDVVSFKSGGTPSMEKDTYWNGDIPWISAASMRGKYYSKSERTITEEGLKNGSKLALEGQLLLLVRGSMLYNKIPIGIAERDVAFNQDLKALIPNKKSYNEFLYQWFSAKQNFLLHKVTGTGIGAGKLDTDDLKSLKLNLPTRPEQQKIASFLSAVDEKIQQLTKKKALLEQYKKGGLQQLFSGQLRFKDENGNHYPDWEEKELDEIAIFRRGKNILASEKGHNYLLGMGAVSESGKLLVNKKTEYDDDFLLKNDLVMPERDIGVGLIIGRVARIDENDKYILGANILSLTINESCVPDYVYYQINDFRFRRKMNRLVNGSAQLMITSKEVKRLGINLPFIEEQQKIATYLSGIDTKIESVNHQITQTQAFKKGLLQQMFV
jgi:type I restriction enzyme S subunit